MFCILNSEIFYTNIVMRHLISNTLTMITGCITFVIQHNVQKAMDHRVVISHFVNASPIFKVHSDTIYNSFVCHSIRNCNEIQTSLSSIDRAGSGQRLEGKQLALLLNNKTNQGS